MMNGETGIVTRSTQKAWEEQLQFLSDVYMKGATPAEVKMFAKVADRVGADPLKKEIYAIKRWDSTEQRYVWAAQFGIDWFRRKAAETGQYQGQVGPQWCGKDGAWAELWVHEEHPFAARVGVMRAGFREPLWAIARWDAYVQTYKNKQGVHVPNRFWSMMGPEQLAKCAEELALRKSFPEPLGGCYGETEMEQADEASVQSDPTPARPLFSKPAEQPPAQVNVPVETPSANQPPPKAEIPKNSRTVKIGEFEFPMVEMSVFDMASYVVNVGANGSFAMRWLGACHKAGINRGVLPEELDMELDRCAAPEQTDSAEPAAADVLDACEPSDLPPGHFRETGEVTGPYEIKELENKRTKEKFVRCGIKVGRNMYGCYDEDPARDQMVNLQIGDNVELVYLQSGRYRNLVSIKKV